MQLNLWFGFFVFLPEIGWYVYGNTFIYSREEAECRMDHPEVERLWQFSLALIIYGYLHMLLLFFVILFGLGAFCLYKSWSGSKNEEGIDKLNSLANKIPIVNHLNETRLRRYDTNAFRRQITMNVSQINSGSTNQRVGSFLRVYRGELRSEVIKECGICFENFNDDDEVVECLLVHVFHTNCFEDNKES